MNSDHASLDRFKAAFFQECDELLETLETSLTSLAENPDPSDGINAAFRAVHSIKGGAAMFGYSHLVAYTHSLENILAGARVNSARCDPSFVQRALPAADMLSDLVKLTRIGDPYSRDFEADLRVLFPEPAQQATQRYVPNAHSEDPPPADDGEIIEGAAVKFRIIFEPSADMLRRGIEPLLLIRNLAALGNLEVSADLSRLPAFADMDPAAAYLRWSLVLETQASRQAIEDVFEFVSETSLLEITSVGALHSEAVSRPGAAIQASSASSHQLGGNERAGMSTPTIRVDLNRVDRLADLVGEITIAQQMILQHFEPSTLQSKPALYLAMTHLQQLSRSLQDGVMAIRAQPIRTIFGRMPRAVREACQQTGKQVQLQLAGSDTEIDRTIIEQLGDPLIHIVRNAIDHGIELPHERVAAGKTPSGTVTIKVVQRGGRIIVEVSDDGRGIDRDAVLQRAIALRLVDRRSALSGEDIDNLIFRPGLSTAASVSNLSGRGVGMDVVHKNIQKLGGRATVRSEPGRGTITTITLPLTLAVMDVLLVHAALQAYLIPVNAVIACRILLASDITYVPGSGASIEAEGRQVPLLDLAGLLGYAPSTVQQRLQVIVLELENSELAAIVVDHIEGHRQVVVKSVSPQLRALPGLTGATILGDGQVAFIIDVCQIPKLATLRDATPRRESQECFAA